MIVGGKKIFHPIKTRRVKNDFLKFRTIMLCHLLKLISTVHKIKYLMKKYCGQLKSDMCHK